MTTWQYVGAFLILGWVLLGICVGLNLGPHKTLAADIFEFLGAASVLTAGAWLARGTWPHRLIGWIVHLHPVIGFVAFLVTLVGIVLFVAAVLPSRVYGGTSVTLSVALFAVFLPSLLIQVQLPGTWGHAVTSVAGAVTTFLTGLTGGAWG